MATGYWTDKGFEIMMDGFFRAATLPSGFLVALVNDTAVGTDDWSDISANEQTGTGYAQEILTADNTGFPTLALDSSEMQIIAAEVTFTATDADWIATTCIALLANMATDRLVAYCNISTVTVGNGESLSATFKLKLSKT